MVYASFASGSGYSCRLRRVPAGIGTRYLSQLVRLRFEVGL